MAIAHSHDPVQIFETVYLWWGYARLHATGTRLAWEFVTDLDGSVIDELVIEKPSDWGARWHLSHNSMPPPVRQVRFRMLIMSLSVPRFPGCS